ncbi:hypothetical protein B5X24_HaOG212731 [Helicoverpa armigera]|uniref:Uncharacterized protein n=1 Tax=Helicoverpa armigera TaxID=29058 RepID=A0A2W1BJ53_HELAM|nr:hypothetical protein B5X24_HaOG212731 [Helicoverpa armigera]
MLDLKIQSYLRAIALLFIAVILINSFVTADSKCNNRPPGRRSSSNDSNKDKDKQGSGSPCVVYWPIVYYPYYYYPAYYYYPYYFYG